MKHTFAIVALVAITQFSPAADSERLPAPQADGPSAPVRRDEPELDDREAVMRRRFVAQPDRSGKPVAVNRFTNSHPRTSVSTNATLTIRTNHPAAIQVQK